MADFKDSNCIIKAFENNKISILQEEDNNKKYYYFKASDVALALDLKNIHVSIQSYEEDEKVIRMAYDQRGAEQNTTFLTSHGIFRLLYNSKKPLAKKFRKWAGNILDDIIFNNSNEIRLQLQSIERQLQSTEQLLTFEKENTLLEKEKALLSQFQVNIQCIYFGLINNKDSNGCTLVKFGMTNNLGERIKQHKKIYDSFVLIGAFRVRNHIHIEK